MFDKRNGRPNLRSNLALYFLTLLVVFFGIYYLTGMYRTPDPDLSKIMELIVTGKVEHVTISNSDIKVKLINEQADKQKNGTASESTQSAATEAKSDKKISLIDVIGAEQTEAELADKNALVLDGREITKKITPYWLAKLQERLEYAQVQFGMTYDYNEPLNFNLIVNSIFAVLMFGVLAFMVWNFMFRQMGDGKNALNFSSNKARRIDLKENPVHFEDVAGADEEKFEIQEIVDFLKNPHKYFKIGAKIPHGVLLVGPPGTGKTLLAKAVATEAGVPFYTISGSDFMEMYVGVGASRVRDMFNEVKKHTPAIIFIDEIDAIGRQRGSGIGGSHDEREQTLNQILVEMDGFSPKQGVIVMAATNRPDILDPALTRPGRFDRQITVSPPDIKGREAILAVHAKGKPLSPDIDFKEIARITPGFTGADLANLLNEAALLAARKNAEMITYFDIQDAIFKVTLGPEKKTRVMSEKERRITAHHEAGHAIMVRAVSETERVERVSIISAGYAGGYTAHKPYEDLYYASKSHLLQNIMIALGGRAGEELIFNEITTGASNDLEHCNATARKMVSRFGMAAGMQNLVFAESDDMFMGHGIGHSQQYSDDTARAIDLAIKDIIDSSYEQVLATLKEREPALKAVAARLLEVERIDEVEFELLYLENTAPEILAKDAENYGREKMKESGNLPTLENLSVFRDEFTAKQAEEQRVREQASVQSIEVPVIED